MSRFTDYVAPEFPEGDSYKPIEHLDRGIVVKVLQHKESIVTENSPDGAPGVICDVLDVAEDKVYRNVLWMSGAVVDGLQSYVGKNLVVIHFEARKSKNGRTYPAPVTATTDELAAATAYFDTHADPFAPVLTTVPAESTPEPAATAAPAPQQFTPEQKAAMQAAGVNLASLGIS